MPKIEIDVDQVLTSAVGLEVEPGDRVFVMNGVIVGLIEKPKPRPVMVTEVTAPLWVQPAHVPATKPQPGSVRFIDDMLVTTALRDGPRTARQLGNILGLKKGGERDRLKRQLYSLRSRNIIVTANNKRFPAYKINTNGSAGPYIGPNT